MWYIVSHSMYQEKILCILSIRYVKLQISETISVTWYQIYNVCNMTSLKNKQIITEQSLLFGNLFQFIQWCECYVCCDWSLLMIYWSTDTCMTSQETCFLCFVQHIMRFRIKGKWKPRKNFARAIYKEEKWRKGEKKSSSQLKNA